MWTELMMLSRMLVEAQFSRSVRQRRHLSLFTNYFQEACRQTRMWDVSVYVYWISISTDICLAYYSFLLVLMKLLSLPRLNTLKPPWSFTVSCVVSLFCPCRALTSLMKTRFSSCLFSHGAEKAELSQSATINTLHLNSKNVFLPLPRVLSWPSFHMHNWKLLLCFL